MRLLRYIPICLLAFACSGGADTAVVPGGNENNDDTEQTGEVVLKCQTLDAEDVTMTTATIGAKCTYSSSYGQIRIYVSSSVSGKEALVEEGREYKPSETEKPVSGTPWELQLSGLDFDCEYHYVAVLSTLDGKVSGDVKSFRTGSLKVQTNPADQITRAKAHLGGAGVYGPTGGADLKARFYWMAGTGKDAAALRQGGTKLDVELTEDGSLWATLTGLSAGTSYSYMAAIRIGDHEVSGPVQEFRTENLPAGAVDMGLSVLWRETNLGAGSRTQVGSYYAWSETSPRTDFTSANYSKNGNKYNDDQTLTLSDDAAYKALGSPWRMPTDSEIEELIDRDKYCTQQWTTVGGVAGLLVTSKKTKNTLFFPAGGYKNGTTVTEGGKCYYWTATCAFHNSGQDSQGITFSSDNSYSSSSFYAGTWKNSLAWYGMPIRPVCD